jgi:Uncharacterised protein family (UPF0175)
VIARVHAGRVPASRAFWQNAETVNWISGVLRSLAASVLGVAQGDESPSSVGKAAGELIAIIGFSALDASQATLRDALMAITFEVPHHIEEQIRTDCADLNRDAKQVYLMEQYRQGKITYRQLEEALGLGFHKTEQILKQRGLGRDLDIEEFEKEPAILREVRP